MPGTDPARQLVQLLTGQVVVVRPRAARVPTDHRLGQVVTDVLQERVYPLLVHLGPPHQPHPRLHVVAYHAFLLLAAEHTWHRPPFFHTNLPHPPTQGCILARSDALRTLRYSSYACGSEALRATLRSHHPLDLALASSRARWEASTSQPGGKLRLTTPCSLDGDEAWPHVLGPIHHGR
jgi:hypothetical protein